MRETFNTKFEVLEVLSRAGLGNGKFQRCDLSRVVERIDNKWQKGNLIGRLKRLASFQFFRILDPFARKLLD